MKCKTYRHEGDFCVLVEDEYEVDKDGKFSVPQEQQWRAYRVHCALCGIEQENISVVDDGEGHFHLEEKKEK